MSYPVDPRSKMDRFFANLHDWAAWLANRPVLSDYADMPKFRKDLAFWSDRRPDRKKMPHVRIDEHRRNDDA